MAMNSMNFKLPLKKRAFWCGHLLMFGMTMCVSGCAGRVVVSFHTSMSVESRPSGTDSWRSAPGSIESKPADKRQVVTYPTYSYNDARISISAGATEKAFGFAATNNSGSKLCLRMGEARIMSEFTKTPIPLRARGPFWPTHITDLSRQEREQMHKMDRVLPPSMCLDPGQSLHASFWVDAAELFPSGYMFNVSWPDNVPKLVSNGVGRWLSVEFPVEQAGIQEQMRITLTVKESKARLLGT